MFDFGGVLTTGPFVAFAQFEHQQGLPDGFIRKVNATNPDSNAWAQLERGEIDLEGFANRFEAEAVELGHRVDGHAVLGLLSGQIRPEMVEAVRRCSDHFKTACLTNNFAAGGAPSNPQMQEIFGLFDFVLESRTAGVRKPEPLFYEMACQALDVAPSEAVFLDDLGINLKPARAMGMHTIKVIDSTQALEELTALTGIEFAH
jgi:putative hydrolase of the HAD superfamily